MKNVDENIDYNEYLLDCEKCILYIRLVNYNNYDCEIIKKYIDDIINKYRYKKEVINFFVNSSNNATTRTMSQTLQTILKMLTQYGTIKYAKNKNITMYDTHKENP